MTKEPGPQHVLIHHAHHRLGEDGGVVRYRLPAVAPAGARVGVGALHRGGIVDAVRTHLLHQSQGQDRDHETEGGVIERMKSVTGDPLRIPLMSKEATSALIFSGAAMHAMTGV